MSANNLQAAAPANLTYRTAGPLVAAVVETFDAMLSARVERTGLALRDEGVGMLDFSAVIGVSGKVTGSFCISFAEETAVEAIARFTGIQVDPKSSLVIDGVGEFTNIIVGAAKAGMDLPLNIGIPNVVSGRGHVIAFPNEARPMRVTFSSDLGPLLIDFGFACTNLRCW